MTDVVAVEWARFLINVNGITPGAFSSECVTGTVVVDDHDGQGGR